MRNFAFAALAAVATAQTNEEGTPQNFPDIPGDADSATGFVNEIVQVRDDGQRSAVLWAQFNTSCNDCTFNEGNVIQNWLQMEGTEPGKFTGFTCNTAYQPDEDWQQNPSIINKTNWWSLEETGATWQDRQDTTDVDNGKWWNQVTNGAEEVYKTTYKKNKYSTQGCGAWAPLYQVDADGNFNGDEVAVLGTRGDGSTMSEMYWKMKNAGSAQMWSGFKLWNNNGNDLYQKSTTVTMDYQFQDLGFVDPNPPAEGDDDTTGDDAGAGDDGEMTESGASALFTAAATAFAAALLL